MGNECYQGYDGEGRRWMWEKRGAECNVGDKKEKKEEFDLRRNE